MINIKKTLLGLSLCLLPWVVHAQVFMCKDAAGKTISSDRPIQECAGAVREYASNGQLRRTIPAPLTPEQKQQKLAEEEKRKTEEAILAEQRRQDKAILARYSNVFEVNAARKRALEQAQERKRRETVTLADSEKKLVDAKAEMAAFNEKNKGKKLLTPQGLVQKIESIETSIQDGKKILEEQDALIAQINAKFDETLKRFNELTAETTK